MKKKTTVTLTTVAVLSAAHLSVQEIRADEVQNVEETTTVQAEESSTQAPISPATTLEDVAVENSTETVSVPQVETENPEDNLDASTDHQTSEAPTETALPSEKTAVETAEEQALNLGVEQASDSSSDLVNVEDAVSEPSGADLAALDRAAIDAALSSTSGEDTRMSISVEEQGQIITEMIKSSSGTLVSPMSLPYTIGYDDKYGKYIVAEEFGVDSTGLTDSLTALNAALEFANRESAAVKLPSGHIYLSNVLRIDDRFANVKGLFGDGFNKTRITFDKIQDGEHDANSNSTDNRDYAGILVENKNGFNIGGFSLEYTAKDQFYRAGKSYFGRVNGIYVNDSSNVLVTDVRVSGVNRAGVFFGSTKVYEVDPRSATGKTYFNRVFSGEITENDPNIPLGVNNKVENSYLYNNRVAGVLFGFQKNFVVNKNNLSSNGHLLDGGTGYGAASAAGSYNYGITYTNNVTVRNYRKGLDVHDGNNIVITDNTSFGDRLNGIAVYNRAFVMDSVQIKDNLVIADPDFRLHTDDGDNIAGYTPVYHSYTAIQIQTNTQFRDWAQDDSKKGNFVISGNQISGIDIYENALGTYGIEFRNHEIDMNYDLVIEKNTIEGKSTKYAIAVINDTMNKKKATPGAGTGNISIQNNKMKFGSIGSGTYPIYILEHNASPTLRGKIDVSNNNLTVTDESNGAGNALSISGSNAETVTVANNNFNIHGVIRNLDKPMVSVNPSAKNATKPNVFILSNAIRTDYTTATRQYNWLKAGDWVVARSSVLNPSICGNTLDGAALPGVGCSSVVKTTTTETITDFVREYREDDSYPIGYQKVIVDGKAGKKVVVYEVTTVDGKEVSKRIISSDVIEPTENQVILIGTGKAEDSKETVVEKTEFQTIIETDPSKPSTYREVLQEGVDGSSEKVYLVTYVGGKEFSRELLSSRTVTEVKPRIIRVGTGVETVKYVTEQELVEYKQVIVYDPTKTKDYEEITTPGQNGSVEKQYKLTYLNGELVNRELVGTTVVQQVQDEVVTKGIGVVVRYENEQTVQEVVHSKVTIEDETKPKGYVEVTQPGQNGVITTVYRVKYEDGKEVERVEVSKVEDPKTIDEITVLGTGEVTEYRDVQLVTVPYRIIYQENPNKPAGEQEVIRLGVNGVVRRVEVITYLNGKEISRKLESETTDVEVVDQIIEIGTYQAKVTKETVKEEEETPFNVVYVQSEDYPAGVTVVQKQGTPGKKVHTYELTYLDGQLHTKTLVNTEEISQPIEEIRIIGTATTTYGEDVQSREIPYSVVVTEEKTLPIGYRDVVQPGVKGTQKDYYKITYVNGIETKRELIKSEVSQQPVSEITIVGTGVTRIAYQDETESVDFEVVYQNDDTLTVGQQEVLQDGQKGEKTLIYQLTYFNDQLESKTLVDTKITKAATPKIIRVGTKVPNTVTITEEAVELDYLTQVEATADKPVGHSKVIRNGQKGQRLDFYEIEKDAQGNVVRKTFLYSQIVTPAVDEVVEMGTGIQTRTTEVVETELPAEIVYVDDENLPAGQTVTQQIGKPGVRRSTYALEYLNGVLVARYLVVSEVVTDPTPTIIRRGTKVESPIVVTTEEVAVDSEIPYESREVARPDKAPGFREVIQVGKPGVVTNYYKVTYENGKEVSRELVRSVVTTAATEEIVQVGTGVVTAERVVVDEKIDYDVVYVNDQTLPKGTHELVREGRSGIKRFVYIVTYLNGEEVSRELVEETVTEPVAHLIRIGQAEPGQPEPQYPDHTAQSIEDIPAMENISNVPVAKNQVLPETGEKKSGLLAALGLFGLGTIAVTSLPRKRRSKG